MADILQEEVRRLTRELGQTIKKDPRVLAYFTAETAYLSNLDLNRYLCEYNADQELIQKEFEKTENRDESLIEVLNQRISELYEKITSHEAYEDLVRAKNDYTELMNAVNEELQSAITGKKTCTHDCSTCGGCHE